MSRDGIRNETLWKINRNSKHVVTIFVRLPKILSLFSKFRQLTVFSVVTMVSIMSVVSAVSPVSLVDVVAIALLGSRVESINDSVGQSGGESTGGSVSQTMGESMTGSMSETMSNSVTNSVSDSVSESLSSSLGGVLGSSASGSSSSTSTSSATSGMGLVSAGNHVLLGSMVSVVAMVSPFFPTGIFAYFFNGVIWKEAKIVYIEYSRCQTRVIRACMYRLIPSVSLEFGALSLK